MEPVLGCQAICNHFALCAYAAITGTGWDGLTVAGLGCSHAMRPVTELCHFEQTQDWDPKAR